jgi:glutaredoxin
MDKIKIYTNETCPYCKSIKEEFNKENIKFEERIGKDWESKWQEVVNLTGMPTVPTVEYNNEYFVPGRDFGNGQQLIKMLEAYADSPHEQSKRIFERVKTLNYNMGQAFQRVDQLLRQIENKLNIKENEHKSTS